MLFASETVIPSLSQQNSLLDNIANGVLMLSIGITTILLFRKKTKVSSAYGWQIPCIRIPANYRYGSMFGLRLIHIIG